MKIARYSLAHLFLGSDAGTSRLVLRTQHAESFFTARKNGREKLPRRESWRQTLEKPRHLIRSKRYPGEHDGAAFQIFLPEIVRMRIVAARSRAS